MASIDDGPVGERVSLAQRGEVSQKRSHSQRDVRLGDSRVSTVAMVARTGLGPGVWPVQPRVQAFLSAGCVPQGCRPPCLLAES